jgi:hypothetical protein
MKTLKNDRISVTFLPLPESTEGLGVRFVLGGWISDFVTADGYSFVSAEFPKDRVVGFGYPDEFITPLIPGNAPGNSRAALKIGVGRINLFRPGSYRFTEEPGVIELFPWEVEEKADSIQWTQDISEGGVAYRLVKEVRLLSADDGFSISFELTNRAAERPLQTLWYYHPFVAPGGMGSHCFFHIPDTLRPSYDFIKALEIDSEGRYRLPDDFSELKSQLLEFSPADMGRENWFVVGDIQHQRRLLVEGDFPLAFFRVWYEPRTFSPEPFYYLSLSPGETRRWSVINKIL